MIIVVWRLPSTKNSLTCRFSGKKANDSSGKRILYRAIACCYAHPIGLVWVRILKFYNWLICAKALAAFTCLAFITEVDAQTVYKCKVTRSDGSVTTDYSSIPCGNEHEHLTVDTSSGTTNYVGRSDPINEISILLKSVNADIAAGHSSAKLMSLKAIIEELQLEIDKYERSTVNSISYNPDKAHKRLTELPEEIAHDLYAAIIAACNERAENVCKLDAEISKLREPYQTYEKRKVEEELKKQRDIDSRKDKIAGEGRPR
jgi:hypothetical protein